MPEFDHTTLVVIDDIADQERASNGHSRYDAYLAQHADDFHDNGEPLSPAEFAAAAWRIATIPVMTPAYAAVRNDLHQVALSIDHNGRAQFCTHVGLHHSALTRRPAGRPLDWEHSSWDRPGEPWPHLAGPDRTHRTVVLVTAMVLLPVPDDILIRPTGTRPSRTLTHEAKTVVAALAEHANRHLAPLVADLLGGTR
ncbi:hypothetical protein [Kitasatospora sp. NPDC056181]|uniref:hypothetical protein n=1 Tax=Kitasatospora sp. NPDC056181 TaxID=3345737 RepID=UPI0035DD36E7